MSTLEKTETKEATKKAAGTQISGSQAVMGGLNPRGGGYRIRVSRGCYYADL
ncbi:Uncharacterised protein [Sphingobacterium daejeonense]|nr:Uncharacterised protein [Sphingobacterium daejeonense]